jgi:exonuclease SbcC
MDTMLRKLKLVNWRNYSLVEIDLEKMNVFIGKNGSGKTNIKAAIEFLFTGKCEYTLAGEKVEELIKDGQGQAIVEGVLDDGTIVRRTVPGDLKVQGWSGNTTTLQKLLMDKLNTTEAVITAVLNTNNFINLKDDQKKNMIFALLGLVFDKAKILQEFQKWSGQRFNDTVLELFNKDVPDTISGGAEVFDKIYKTFYANRTGVNRTKKELETLSEKQQMPDIPEGINMDDKPAVEELLKDLRKERDSILQSKTTDERAKKQLQEAINRKEAYVNAATKIREELKKVTEGRANIADINKQITELEKKIVTKQDEANEVNRKIHESVGSVNSTHTTLQSLKSRKDNSCPVAPGTITCPMGDDEFAKIIDKIEKTYERDNAKLLTFREKGAKLAEELVPMKEEMRSLRSKLEAVDTTTKKENHLLLEAAKQDALAESENLIIDNANLGAEVNYDEKVALFDERILKGEGILSKMNSYDEA